MHHSFGSCSNSLREPYVRRSLFLDSNLPDKDSSEVTEQHIATDHHPFVTYRTFNLAADGVLQRESTVIGDNLSMLLKLRVPSSKAISFVEPEPIVSKFHRQFPTCLEDGHRQIFSTPRTLPTTQAARARRRRHLYTTFEPLNATVSRNEKRQLSTTQVAEINCKQARLSGQRVSVKQPESLPLAAFSDRHSFRLIETALFHLLSPKS